MKNIVVACSLLFAGIHSAQACEMESVYRKCSEAVGDKPVQAKVNIEGTSPDDFVFNQIGNFLIIKYERQITQDRQGTLEIKKADGTVSNRPIAMKAKGVVVDAEEKHEKMKRGLKSLFDELKPSALKK
ncbi:hypothetical protein MAFF241648_21620 [Ralstonia solanacearum]|nr:hypothetical protein MAFF241648_21620 [Ralstonia solanacearum]